MKPGSCSSSYFSDKHDQPFSEIKWPDETKGNDHHSKIIKAGKNIRAATAARKLLSKLPELQNHF